jgi:hypothetical protein
MSILKSDDDTSILSYRKSLAELSAEITETLQDLFH